MFLDFFFFKVMGLDIVAKKKKVPKAQKAEVLFPCGQPELRLQGGARQCPVGSVLALGSVLAGNAVYSFQIPGSNSAQPPFALTSCQKSQGKEISK